jgi:branched-chain amino acid transport system substrate-binding protein
MKELLWNKAITKLQGVIIAIVVIIAAIVAGVYFYFRPSTPEAILIGVPGPLTGPGAQMGEPLPWIVSHIENAVNKEGGIYIEDYGKKLPIKFLLKDTQTDFDLTASVTEELITKDGVSLILVPIGALTMPAAGMKAEKYSAPCILHFCPPTTIRLVGPSKWIYYTTFSFAEGALMLVQVYKQAKTNGVMGGLWVNNADGQLDRNITLSLARREGLKVVDLGLYSPGLTDFSPYIEQLKAQKAEICHAYCWFEESAIFWRQCREMGYIPKVANIGMAAAEPSTVAALGGDLGLGLIGTALFLRAYPFRDSVTGNTVKELFDTYTKETGKVAGVNMGSYAGFEIAVDVLKRAKSLDKEKIRNALAETNLDTSWGNINFKKPYSQVQKDLYAQFEPEIIEQQDRVAVLPRVAAQWFRENGQWVQKVIYNWIYTDIPVEAEIISIPGSE